MKNFNNQKISSVYINMVGFFIILVIFIVMSFCILTMELQFYSSTKSKIDNTFNSTTVVSYINNKVRNYNSKNISVLEDGENDILKLVDNEEKYLRYIYIDEGYLCEEITSLDDKLDKSKGQKLFLLDNITMNKKTNVIQLTISLKNKRVTSYLYVN